MEEKSNNAKKEETITLKKSDLWKYSTFILAAILVVGIFVFYTGEGNPSGNVVNNNPGNLPTQPSEVKVDISGSPAIGDKSAPVTIVEFSDYQCPFCRKFWTETYPSIKSEYIDTGKVKLVFKDFPLSIHAMAQKSSEAARCVGEKGGDKAYFEYHDKMFEEQNIIDSGNAAGPVTKTASYTAEDLKAWAKEMGYDIASCLDSGKYASAVQKDFAQGQQYGVSGTPSFFVNGKLLSGA